MAKVSKRLLQMLRDEHRRYIDAMTPEEIEALKAHLDGPYTQGPTDPATEFDGLTGYGTEALARQMRDIIRRAPRTKLPMTVFRGEPDDQSLLEQLRSYDYPMSTSLDEDHALTYAESAYDMGRLSHIEVPPGSPGLYVPENERFELPFKEEFEFVLPRSQGRETQLLNEMIEEPELESFPRIRYQRKKYVPPYRRGGLRR